MVVELSPNSITHEKQDEAVGMSSKTHSSNIMKYEQKLDYISNARTRFGVHTADKCDIVHLDAHQCV